MALAWVDGLQSIAGHLSAGTLTIPAPPEGVRGWPIVGGQIYTLWDYASTNLRAALRELAPHLKPLAGPVLAFAGSAGLGALKFVAAVALSGFLFHYGPRLVTTIKRIQARLVTQRSQDFVALAGLTIRTVANGVIGVAVLQALLAGIGLKLAGVPHAGLLAFAVLILAVLQIGSAVVLIPVMIWIWATKDFAAALPSNDRGRRTRVIENQKHVRCGKNRRRGSGTNSTCRYQEGKQASLCERQANVAGTRQDNF